MGDQLTDEFRFIVQFVGRICLGNFADQICNFYFIVSINV